MRRRSFGYGSARLWCCAAVLLLFWALALKGGGRLAGFTETLGLRYAAGEGLTAEQVERARELAEKKREPFPGITLWEEKRGQTVSSGLREVSDVRALLFSGSGETVLPGSLLAGSYPAQGDETGCAVDRRLAMALWGTENAVGNRLSWEGAARTVRGVFDAGAVGGEALLLPVGRGGKEAVFSCAELRFEGSGDPNADARAFLTRYGLPAPAAVADAVLAGQLCRLLLLLPGWTAAGWALARLLRRLWRVRESTLLLTLSTAGALPLGAALLWAAQAGGELPVRFIPSRWSDFSFWQTLWDEVTGNLRQLLSLPLTVRETALLSQLLPTVLAALAALLPLALLLERIRFRSGRRLLASMAVYSALAFLCLWAARPALPAGRGFWLALPLCFAADLLLFWWDGLGRTPRPQSDSLSTPQWKEGVSIAPVKAVSQAPKPGGPRAGA